MIYNIDNTLSEDTFILSLDESIVSNIISGNSKWKTGNEKHSTNKYVSNSLSDEEYEKLKKDVEIMKSTESYDEYKKALSRFCYFCNISPRGLILKKYDLKKGKGKGDNSIEVEYTNNSKKISLPSDTKLYHMSKVGGIKELIPVFRGKSEKGYMYDKPRVYFTIRKNMPKFLADYKFNQKMHLYLCKKNIDQVFVDPLVPNYLQGAVYVETKTPIPVEEVTESNLDKIKSLIRLKKEDKTEEIGKETDVVKESDEFDFEDFFKFVTENGLLISEDN